jgi:hypothetical protein
MLRADNEERILIVMENLDCGGNLLMDHIHLIGRRFSDVLAVFFRCPLLMQGMSKRLQPTRNHLCRIKVDDLLTAIKYVFSFLSCILFTFSRTYNATIKMPQRRDLWTTRFRVQNGWMPCTTPFNSVAICMNYA